VNLLFQELVEAERRNSRLAESAHYRLIKEAQKQNMNRSDPLFDPASDRLLEKWGRWFLKVLSIRPFSNRYAKPAD
jgi:hypothetical protein